MAGMCCGVNIGETGTAAPVEPSSKSARRRRIEIHNFKFVSNDFAVAQPLQSGGRKKRQKIEMVVQEKEKVNQLSGEMGGSETKSFYLSESPSSSRTELGVLPECPKFGMTSVCGRRRDMEDAVAIHPSFCGRNDNSPSGLHFFGVYDGHGCSHVATKCKDRMHEIVKDEFESGDMLWERTMFRSF